MNQPTFHSLNRWDKRLVRAVGRAYRQNGAEGTLEPQAWFRIRDAYLAAGGDPAIAATEPNVILATLARVYPAWLHETAMDAEQPHRRQEREARHGRSLDRLRAVVGEWAQGEPLVRMVWLIGSRAVGDPYPGSDVDLVLSLSSDPAVVAQGAQGRGAVLTLMRQDRREAWQAALQERIAQEVQVLVLFRDNDIVRDAVKREGVCLYRRRAAPGLRKAP
ncbi:hypothetical protein J5Y09_14810 [Roseomonas sp. PWR1]|uniref:Polymerase beta nucleotidyltransferase domain-containing protein n=1 Tax=Roseomonas nitratireducens TaxID=2820810 RepID=A0ABS4AVB3_9PROT|nr:hypothetical protein [Neoroseomonas nitratireducens]